MLNLATATSRELRQHQLCVTERYSVAQLTRMQSGLHQLSEATWITSTDQFVITGIALTIPGNTFNSERQFASLVESCSSLLDGRMFCAG